RAASLTLLAVPPVPPTACADLLGDGAGGGVGAFHIGFDGPNIRRLAAAIAPPAPDPAAPPRPGHFGLSLVVRNQKTVGAGACAGCDVPVCVGLAEIRVLSVDFANDVDLLGGPESGVTWQGAHLLQYEVIRRPSRANSTIVCSTTDVPVRAET